MSEKKATEGIIYLSNVRISFPHLSEPQRTLNEKTGQERISYNACFLFAPNDPAWTKFWQTCVDLCTEKWKANAPQVIQMINAERKQRCYGRGEEVVNKTTFQPYDGYAGMFYINAGRDRKPQIIDSQGQSIDIENAIAYNDITRKIYGGCRVNTAIKPWIQDNKHGRGIRCDLIAVQFAKDDTPFGTQDPDVTEQFSAIQEALDGPTPAGSSYPLQAQGASFAMPPAPFSTAPGLPSFLT